MTIKQIVHSTHRICKNKINNNKNTYFCFKRFCCSIRHNDLKSVQKGTHNGKKSFGFGSSPVERPFGWKW